MKNKLSKRNLNPKYSKEIYEIERIIRPREKETTVITPIKYKLKGTSGLFYRMRLLKTVSPSEQVGYGTKDNDVELERNDSESDSESDNEKEKKSLPEIKQRKKSIRKRKNINYKDLAEGKV